MSWIGLYATHNDLRWVLSVLNADPEIAFIGSAGEKAWVANKTAELAPGTRYCLWHVPSGPLPLLRADGRLPDSTVRDPWAGWTEERAGADPSSPYFGSGHVGIVWLNARSFAPNDDYIRVSGFEWIGNHYRPIGRPTHPSTDRWWRRLRKTLRKQGAIMGPRGPHDRRRFDICARPEAFAKIARDLADPWPKIVFEDGPILPSP